MEQKGQTADWEHRDTTPYTTLLLRVNTPIQIGEIRRYITAVYGENSGEHTTYSAYVYPPDQPPFPYFDQQTRRLVSPNYSYKPPLDSPADLSAVQQQVVTECRKNGYISKDAEVKSWE